MIFVGVGGSGGDRDWIEEPLRVTRAVRRVVGNFNPSCFQSVVSGDGVGENCYVVAPGTWSPGHGNYWIARVLCFKIGVLDQVYRSGCVCNRNIYRCCHSDVAGGISRARSNNVCPIREYRGVHEKIVWSRDVFSAESVAINGECYSSYPN